MGPKCQSNPAPAPRQPLPARTVNGSERKLKISCKSMGEESPRNVSLHDCHCRGGAWRRSGLRGQGEGRDQDGEAAPSGLLSLTLTSGPSLDPLVATSLCFQNPSISSPHHLELPPPSPPWGPCFCLCNSDRVPCFAQNAPPPFPQSSHLAQRRIPRPHVPGATGPLRPLPPVPLAVLTPRRSRSAPCCYLNAQHDAAPGPSHLRSPLPGILSPHTFSKAPGALSLNITSSEASLSTLATVDRPPPGPRYSSPCFISCISASKITLYMFP